MKKYDMDRMKSPHYSDGLHQMIRLTYISQASKHVKTQDLKNILAKARTKNKERGITGILVFNNAYFLQSIEGSRPVINDLLRSLSVDKRHFNLQVVQAEEIQERRWSQWFMDYVSPNVKNKATFLQYSSIDRFNPYLMKADSIRQMLVALSSAHEPLREATTPSPAPSTAAVSNEMPEEVAQPPRKRFGLF